MKEDSPHIDGPAGAHGADGVPSLSGPYAEPEVNLLRAVFVGAPFVARLARAPGGWRALSEFELEALGLTGPEQKAILALQDLVRRAYPELPRGKFASSANVGHVYQHRLGGLAHEVMVAVCLDGGNHFVAELEVGRGGAHSLGILPSDVLRPVIRTGANAFLLVHNHPSGDPIPSAEDLAATRAVSRAAKTVGVPLVDHVIVGARGGGFNSLLDLGVIDLEGKE